MERDKKSRSLAKAMSERLLSNIGQNQRMGYLQQSEIYSADVEVAVERFGVQLNAARQHGTGLPCLFWNEGRRPIPVDLGTHYFWDVKDSWYRLWPDLLALWKDTYEFGDSLTIQEPKDTLSLFRSLLEDFLTVRFSVRQSNISLSPGLRFEVTTLNSGMRVYYSPAYFFTFDRVFGSPTTPVVHWIQPGRYVFGVKDPSAPRPIFDHGEYDIPPTEGACLQL